VCSGLVLCGVGWSGVVWCGVMSVHILLSVLTICLICLRSECAADTECWNC